MTDLSRHLLKIAEAVTSPVGRCRLVVNCTAMTYRFKVRLTSDGPVPRSTLFALRSLCNPDHCAVLTTRRLREDVAERADALATWPASRVSTVAR